MACIEKFCTHKPSSEPVWKTPNRPPNINVYLSHFVETGLLEKKAVYAHTDPFAKEIGDVRYFGIKRLITLNSIKSFKLKFKKL